MAAARRTTSLRFRTRTNKYYATKTDVDGIRFDSQREAARYRELRLLERAGEITDLRLQVPFYLWAGVPGEVPRAVQLPKRFQWRADFVYREVGSGAEVVEDAKGWRRPCSASRSTSSRRATASK